MKYIEFMAVRVREHETVITFSKRSTSSLLSAERVNMVSFPAFVSVTGPFVPVSSTSFKKKWMIKFSSPKKKLVSWSAGIQ